MTLSLHVQQCISKHQTYQQQWKFQDQKNKIHLAVLTDCPEENKVVTNDNPLCNLCPHTDSHVCGRMQTAPPKKCNGVLKYKILTSTTELANLYLQSDKPMTGKFVFFVGKSCWLSLSMHKCLMESAISLTTLGHL